MAPTSLEGLTLGKYRVLEPLGRGGMAQVYRAYHPQLDRYVAVKVLRSDLIEEGEFLARFQREARAIAGLRHPNIVQVFDFDVQDDIYFMVMELLEGDTLKAYMNTYRTRGDRIPIPDMVRILTDVLDGLAFAHSEGITHRDIKPANIMLTRRCQAVITDFGIAQILGATHYTISGALMGTLHYMAPEQGLEGHGDSRSDIYSLGIVFFEMLTGHPPFEADTPLAILMKHLNDPLPLPHSIDPTIPEPLERVLLKALSKRPDDRYQNAEEMATALRNAAAEAQITIPEHISLPISFAAGEPVTGPGAVYSGTAREQIAGASFAADDTDSSLGDRLKAGLASLGNNQAPDQNDPPIPGAVGLRSSHQDPAPLATLLSSWWNLLPPAARAGIAGGLTLLGFNIWAVMFSSATKGFVIYKFGWPVELFLVGIILCLMMAALNLVWLMIPAGLVLGNAVIFSYFSLTGRWGDWLFMWPLEPLLLVASLALTFSVYNQGTLKNEYIRKLTRLFCLGSTVGVFLIVAASILKGFLIVK